ncbi:MAG TPA: hypothetical protein VN253_06420 [Kofleriaceae bacterium]|nr:hypothetical protein [Kofleriaceae bacterium]
MRHRSGWVVAAAAAASTVGCGGDEACDPAAEVCVLERAVSTIDVPAGVEDEDTCQSWTLNNPTELWVNGITQHNDGAYHHANWFFVPDDQFAVPDGSWRCSEHQFDEVVAALLGGYLFALSTQSLGETQTLPAGSAIRIPPYSRVIGSSHLLNASDQTVSTTMQVALHTIPPPAVKAKLAPARIQYIDLKLDPMQRSSFTTECLIDTAHQMNTGQPLQYELHYTLAHYHSLGVYTQLEIAGGPRDGEVLARHDGYGENFGGAIDPPIDLGQIGARGVRFTCGFTNPRNAVVRWGIGDQEMCVIAIQARTNLGWTGDALRGTGQQVGVGPTGEVHYQAPCSLTAFPWDFEKRGGPPR